MGFVNNVDKLLKEKNLLRADIIRATGISESSFRNWQRGSAPAVDAALKIAQYLGTTVEALMSDEQAPDTWHPSVLVQNIEARLEQLCLTPEEFCKIIGIDRATYNSWSKGNLPSLDLVPKINKVLGSDYYGLLFTVPSVGTVAEEPREYGKNELFGKIEQLKKEDKELIEKLIDRLLSC